MGDSVLSFHDYLSPSLQQYLLSRAKTVNGTSGAQSIQVVREEESLPPAALAYESDTALQFCCDLYEKVRDDLGRVLERRITDRTFIDDYTSQCRGKNAEKGTAFDSEDYETVIGAKDANGRVVIGPSSDSFREGDSSKPVAPLPEHLKGKHVTLFGPPDSAKMAINAMNCAFRRIPDEPAIVTELVERSSIVPKWGADDEDSKTPLHDSFLAAGVSLQGCFDKSLRIDNDPSGKTYEIKDSSRVAHPIKRVPGLTIPSAAVFYRSQPVPLHVYDFALHVYNNWQLGVPALTFYVPKLENEEEAKYFHSLCHHAEEALVQIAQAAGKTYIRGSIRLFLVFENPRAIFRISEMIDALHPYFAGGSLGWHDFLASTARLFREDPNYRIPVKADPNIVINNIRESHTLLADVVGPRGGIKIGGMYGVLPRSNVLSDPSFQVCMHGYIRDVTTQLKRGLDGFWVAHPDFVRIGIAIVEAWFAPEKTVTGDAIAISEDLVQLVRALVLDSKKADDLLAFITGPDLPGLDPSSSLYARAVLAANINVSDVIANDDPKEVGYNVFQALQYLADWLAGNGCVALPAIIGGESVRVMDDLATTERSRWEIWAEYHHGRVTLPQLMDIFKDEVRFIRAAQKVDGKEVHVQWNQRTAKWYPIALRILIILATDGNPVEFATELLVQFTVPAIRREDDPWQAAIAIDSTKLSLPADLEGHCADIIQSTAPPSPRL